MNIEMAKKCVKEIFKSNLMNRRGVNFNIVPLLRGFTGIGKTQIFSQIAEELEMNLVVIHLSQMSDVGDLMGLIEVMEDKSTGEKYSKFISPRFLPRTGKNIFLLDEFNQSRPDVRTACFEFLLSLKLGDYTAPEGSLVAAAENPDTIDYKVVSFENAALNARFCILKIDPDVKEWAAYARKNPDKFSETLVSFLEKNPDYFKYKNFEQFSVDSDVTLTFRSTEMITQIEKLSPEEDVFSENLAGFGGIKFAVDYIAEKKEQEKKIHLDLNDILNSKKFEDIEHKIKEISAHHAAQGRLCRQLFDYIVKK